LCVSVFRLEVVLDELLLEGIFTSQDVNNKSNIRLKFSACKQQCTKSAAFRALQS